MEKLETSSKVERYFPQRGRTGYTREGKRKTPGPKVAKKVRTEKPQSMLYRKVWPKMPKLETVTNPDSGIIEMFADGLWQRQWSRSASSSSCSSQKQRRELLRPLVSEHRRCRCFNVGTCELRRLSLTKFPTAPTLQ